MHRRRNAFGDIPYATPAMEVGLKGVAIKIQDSGMIGTQA
jgi:hypothetical protein